MLKLFSKIVLAAMIVAIMLPIIFAQEDGANKELPYPYQFIFDARKENVTNHYLTVNNALKDLENNYLRSKRRGSFLQAIAVSDSQIGEYQEALAYFDRYFYRDGLRAGSGMVNYHAEDALKVIASYTGSKQAVFINEAHHVPLHRAFVIKLLPILYQQGYRYLAIEGLGYEDKELNQRGYALFNKTGFYTDEPLYADLIRTALKLGYKLIAYEDPGDSTETEREIIQAKNLYEYILKEDAKAKFIVHAGYDHIRKKNSEDQTLKTVAMQFKSMTNIEPFSIDQVNFTEGSAAIYEPQLYQYLLNANDLNDAVIFRDKEGKPYVADDGKFDLQIVHPYSHYENGRPTWLLLNGKRDYYQLNNDPCKGKYPCLAQAFVASEGELAVPIDQIKIDNSYQVPALVLPKGDFLLRFVDKEGNILHQGKISMKNINSK